MPDAGERHQRASKEEIELTIVDGDTMAVNSETSDEAHLLRTSGIAATDCTCPDYLHRRPESGCKHMIAWEKWLIDRVRFSDGEIAWTA